MQNIDFNNIRPSGSLNEGFEELVCQLAHRMDVPGSKRFVRNGRPDGGAECYWELENGDLWMWQAKYFASTPGPSQFEQISDSVKTALRLHKNVKRYYIAVPQDLPDDGKGKTKSARKRYEEKKKQWQKIEGAEGSEFIYWGKHELTEMLSRKENEGLLYFWFNKTEFTEDDFEHQNKKAIEDLGTRYTPKLNIELDIAKSFDGLSRNKRFEERFKNNIRKFKNVWQRVHPSEEDKNSEEYAVLENNVENAFGTMAHITFSGIESLPLESLKKQINKVAVSAQEYIKYLENRQRIQKASKDKGEKKDYNYAIRDVWKAYYESSSLIDYLSDTECKAVNLPIMVLEGEAGVGKSHLLADVVEGRRKDGRYSLLLLGQHFNAQEDPWTQIFKQLKFEGNEYKFLQALEAKAETSGERIIIFIDALNEGGGKDLWRNYIASFVHEIKSHPWLGLVMSIRTTYTRFIFGEDKNDGVLWLSHSGFENRSFEAIKLFFKNSNISLPSVPLLLPEFKNPLFLKLFCDGLHKNGLTKIDEGIQGISSVLNLFIDGVEKAIAQKKNTLPELHVVGKAVNVLIDYQVANLTTEVPLDKAFELTNNVKTDKFSDGELLYELISYGVLSRNMRYRGDKQYEEVVYLSYERFNDFLTARRLLETSENAEIAVSKLIKKSQDLRYYGGIVESLAVIAPEKDGREIYEILPTFRDSDIVVDSVLKSLLWRKTSTIDKKLVDYFNEVMTEDRFTAFIATLIQVGTTKNHFFNAEFLHRNLMRWKMAERDQRWSVHLKSISVNHDNPVETLITWAREDLEQMRIDPESKYLTGILLGWFTTCMDRRIRDYASKGLVTLVRNDADLMIRLIEKFDGVDDPYVMERIYAAAYGCALLSEHCEQLQNLSKSVYKHIFDTNGEVYPDAQVRDYARGVIEYTLTKYPSTTLGTKSFRPPYNSSFYDTFPTDEETKAYSKKDKDGKWTTPGIDSILRSMVTEHGYTIYGDFGRYIFQSHLSGWDIDPQQLSNLAVKWIMEKYGYKEELFGEYDSSINRGRMRQVYPGERVGKKYQWIALYEMVARLSDNFPMKDSWTDKEVEYNGTWEPYIRDFDPTMLLKKRIPAWGEEESKYWWNRLDYAEWNSELSVWTRQDDNLPDPTKVIESVDYNGTSWIALQAMPDWVEPHDKETGVYRNLWYQIRSYIIDDDKFADFALWAIDQNFTGRWMPEASERYEMFSREYYWSEAYRYYEVDGMTCREVYDRKENYNERRKIADVELPCVKYLWESEYDCSKPDTVSYLKPSKALFEGMGMRYSDVDGELTDDNGNLICFDACANHNSHGYFLVRKDALLQYLQKNNKRILWVLIGEKNLTGAFMPHGEWLEISGAFYLDAKDEVKGSMTTYLEGKPLRTSQSNKQKTDILENYGVSKTEKFSFDSEQRNYAVLDVVRMLSGVRKLKVDGTMSEDIWDVTRRSKYIESILVGLPLTTITVARENDGSLNVLDGSQRLKAIQDYVNGKYALRSMNMVGLYEDRCFEKLPPMAKSRLTYAILPFNVIVSDVDEKTRAEIYNRLNAGLHQISEHNRRLLQYRGRMTDTMETLLNDRHFKQLTKGSGKSGNEQTKEDIALHLIMDYVITHGSDSFVQSLHGGYQQQLKDVARFINITAEDVYVEDIGKRLKEVLKGISEGLGKDIIHKIDGRFSMPLLEILVIAYLYSYNGISKESSRDIIYTYIENNAYKILRAGNDSVVKLRERLMLAQELTKELNK